MTSISKQLTTPITQLIVVAAVCIATFLPLAAMAQTTERILPIQGEAVYRKSRALEYETPYGVAISPDGSQALYAVSRWVMRVNTRADGRWRGVQFWIVELATGRRVELIGHPASYASWWSGNAIAQWTPDGRRLAYLESGGKSGPQLLVWDAAVGGEPQRLRMREFEPRLFEGHAITDWVWTSSADELLVCLSPTTAGPTKRLPTKKAFTFFSSREDAQERDFLKKRAELNAAKTPMRLARVDLNTRSVREITSPKPLYGVKLQPRPDRKAVYVMAWDSRFKGPLSEDLDEQSRQLMLVFSPLRQARQYQVALGDVLELNFDDNRWRAVSNNRHEPTLELAPSTGGSDLVSVERDSNQQYGTVHGVHCARIRRVGGAPRPTDDLVAGVSDLTRVFPSDRSGVVYFHDPGVMDSVAGVYELDSATGKRERIDTSGLRVSRVDVSADGSVVAGILESVNHRPALHVWTTRGRQWRQVGGEKSIDDPLLAARIARREFITWRSREGKLQLDGTLIKPLNFDPSKRHPLIISVQGGSDGATVRRPNEFDPSTINHAGFWTNVAAEEGYLVLLANHRGSEYMGAEHVRLQKGDRLAVSREDLAGAIDYLAAKGWVNPERVGIFGHSAGGSDVGGALANTNLFKAGIVNDGFILMEEVYSAAVRHIHHSGAYGSPKFTASLLREVYGFNPLEKRWSDPYKIRAPVLIRYSSKGADVSWGFKVQERASSQMSAQTGSLVRALEANRVPYEVIYDADEHGIISSPYDLEWTSRVIQWFDFFMSGKGEIPLPAMKSPYDYSKLEDGLIPIWDGLRRGWEAAVERQGDQ